MIQYNKLFTCFLFFALTFYAQAQTSWERVFVGAQANSIKPTTDNHYILTGSNYLQASNPAMGSHILLQKISPTGTVVWSQNIATATAPSTLTQGGDVVANPDGTYTGFGTARLLTANEPAFNNFYWYKTNASGEVQSWVSLGDSATFKTPHTIIRTNNGDYVALGEGKYGADSDPDYRTYLIKTNTNGLILWQKVYEGKIGRAVVATADGGYVIVGAAQGATPFQVTYQLWKVDANGNMVWEVSGEGGNIGNDLQATADGGWVTIGGKMVKHASTGAISWTQNHQGNAIVVNADGTFNTTTTENNVVNNSPNLAIKRYTAAGLLSSTNQVGPNGSNEVGYDIVAATDGGYVAVGSSTANAAEQVYAVKTTPSGGGITISRAELSCLNPTAPASLAPVSLATVGCQVRNTGLITAGFQVLQVYLSSDNVLGEGDFLAGSLNISSLGAGAISTVNLSINVPNWAAGNYSLLFVADAGKQVFEATENNNMASLAVAISGQQTGSDSSDLSVPSATLSNTNAVALGSTITANVTVLNGGAGPAVASVLGVYWSANATYEPANDVALTQANVSDLLSNQSATLSGVSISLPTTLPIGSAFLLFISDQTALLTETNEANNMLAQAITIISNTPDLIVQNPTAPSATNNGATVSVGCTVSNLSSQPTTASVLKYYLSTDNVYNLSDTYLAMSNVAAVGASSSLAVSASLTIPTGTLAGAYFILYVADANSQIAEYNETNNTANRAININNGAALPDLVVQSPIAPASVVAGNNMTLTCVARNQGTSSSAANNLKFYLSTDITYQTYDVYLGVFALPTLSPNATVNVSKLLTMPASTVNGNYYLIYRTDADGIIAESSETNNNALRLIGVANGPDLMVQNQTAPTTANVGASINTSCRVRNQGIGSAGASMLKYYLSTDISFSANDVLLDSTVVNTLMGGSFWDLSKTITLPASITAGSYFLIFRADANNQVNNETSEANNNAVRSINIGSLPDLIPQNLIAPTSTTAGTTITVGCRVSNIGTANAANSTVKFYLSTNTFYEPTDTYLGMQEVAAINAASNIVVSQTVAISPTTIAGNYYLIYRTDADNQFTELSETNNNSARTITIANAASAQADLLFNHLNTPPTAQRGASIAFSFDITNMGTASSPSNSVAYYLSPDNSLDPADVYLGATTIAPINAGTSSVAYNINATISVNTTEGNYFLIFAIDANNIIPEPNEANNLQNRAISIAGIAALPDFVTTNPIAPATAVIGNATTMGCTLSNIGTASATASRLKYYLSTDNTYSSNDVYVGQQNVGVLSNGSAINLNQIFTIPPAMTVGNYFVLYVSDANGEVVELNEANNNSSKPITLTNTSSSLTDLSLSITATPTTIPSNSSTFIVLSIQNNSATNATDIVVSFPKPVNLAYEGQSTSMGTYSYWGDAWTIPSLAAGQTASLQLSLYSINSSGSVLVFAQIQSADQPDIDSTPNNNVSNTPFEDDETATTLSFTPAANKTATADGSSDQPTTAYRFYPNPAHQQLHIEWLAPVAADHNGDQQDYTIQLFNTLGALVYQYHYQTATAGVQHHTIPTNELPTAAYVCRITAANFASSVQQKILLIH